MMNVTSEVNNGNYESVYTEIFTKRERAVSIEALHFLYECSPVSAYNFLLFCMERTNDIILRFALCEYITYGDIFVENSHFIVRELILSILADDPHYLPALELAIYNYHEHPESPFTEAEIVSYANTILQYRLDNVAKSIVNRSHISDNIPAD